MNPSLLRIRAAQSLSSMCRHEPHREHVSSPGKTSTLTTPAWPHGQAIRSNIGVLPVSIGGEPNAIAECVSSAGRECDDVAASGEHL
jgi:hypothetical protein